jgi:hypothetical protein
MDSRPDGYERLLRANVRSAVHVFMGEAGVTFALSFAVLAIKCSILNLTRVGFPRTVGHSGGLTHY